jgi:hypothetical protein
VGADRPQRRASGRDERPRSTDELRLSYAQHNALREDLFLYDLHDERREREHQSGVGSAAPRSVELPATHLYSGTPQNTPSEQVNGTFTWAYNLPTTLTSLWSVGTDNVVLRAALETFQSQSNLPVTGEADPTTWSDLLTAVDDSHVDPATYDYVSVTEQLPEMLTLYVAGKVKFTTLVNTGIEVAPTELGTFPVYVRFISTTMSGKNPDGTTYHDPGIPWVSYFNGGDALHGFIRSSYGFPQSLGCVEMPFASAQTVFPYTPIGTLVTVHD